jgi:hypothetical protein
LLRGCGEIYFVDLDPGNLGDSSAYEGFKELHAEELAQTRISYLATHRPYEIRLRHGNERAKIFGQYVLFAPPDENIDPASTTFHFEPASVIPGRDGGAAWRYRSWEVDAEREHYWQRQGNEGSGEFYLFGKGDATKALMGAFGIAGFNFSDQPISDEELGRLEMCKSTADRRGEDTNEPAGIGDLFTLWPAGCFLEHRARLRLVG